MVGIIKEIDGEKKIVPLYAIKKTSLEEAEN